MTFSCDVQDLLLARGDFGFETQRIPLPQVLRVVILCGAVHGLVMGAHSGSILQMLLSACKVPMLIMISTCLCLPSLFMLATVGGLRDDLRGIVRAVFASQATVAVTLCQLAPLLIVFYVSTNNYEAIKAFNAGLFLLASIAGQVTLQKHYAVLVRRDPRHVWGQRVWLVLYILVTIQLAWLLRPFIGSPGMDVQIFRESAWGNAYVELLQSLVRALSS